jgi:CheY-like chemotaxis protein
MRRHVVLAVDDSADDLSLMKMAAAKAAPNMNLRIVQCGEDAIRYVTGEGEYADREIHPLPRLIILDLKMPRVTGFDVMQNFRENNVRRPPFIVVLSASDLQQDKDKAMHLGATAYHVKPILFDDLCSLMSRLDAFFCLSK